MLVDTRNKRSDYELNDFKIECVQGVKDLDVTMASHLKITQQCKNAGDKANRLLGIIKRKFSFKNENIILPLYNQTTPRICRAILVAAPQKGHTKNRSCSAKGHEDDHILCNKCYEGKLQT